MLDRTEQQNAVGGVLGDRDLDLEIGIVAYQCRFNRLGCLCAREPGQHHFAGQRQRDAPIGPNHQLGLHERSSGKIHADFVAFA